jgi:hypothetical protein
VNWIADAEPASFEGGEFCWATIELRDFFKERKLDQFVRKGADAPCHRQLLLNQLGKAKSRHD